MQHFRTIVISDLHLGTDYSKIKEVLTFLKNHTYDKLILNGDIIDAWHLKKRGTWRKRDARFFKYLVKIIINKNVEVIYLRGNHDDFLDHCVPLFINNFSIRKTYIHEGIAGRYFVIHGDAYDPVTKDMTWLAHIGDIGYNLLLKLNKHYNQYRLKRGRPYFSISQKIKAGVKQALSFIADFEKELSIQARKRNCIGIICGHIHTPANKMIDGIHYLNSGDWVESCTALTEDETGHWEVVHFHEWNAERLKNKMAVKKLIDSTINH
jgi:UDP-2,3-diacylglucosamine pyrophosphatase LpxH